MHPTLKAVPTSPTPPSWRDAGEREHFAQVYESDAVLLEAAAGYVNVALGTGAAAIVVATAEHLVDLQQRWRKEGIDIDAARDRGQLLLLDAQATLDRILDDGMPQRERFGQAIGSAVAQAHARFPRLVAFGEMVDLLWSDGRFDAAIALEDLWNELALVHPFTLFCAYRLRGSGSGQHLDVFDTVCSKHARIIPGESAFRMYAEDPLRVIAMLQQKTALLDQEVQRREQVEAEMALLAAIVASSDDAIVSKTVDGVIRSWNAGAQRIFGYTAEEAVGQPITLIIPEELRDEERRILAKVRGGDRIDHFETQRVAKDGRRIPISLSVSPVRNAEGQIIGAAKIARDISDRHRAEQAAVEENRSLIALNEWSTRLWRCQSLDQGLEQMLDAVIELLGADKGNIQLLNDQVLRIASHRGFDQPFLDAFREVSADQACACARVLRSGQREIIGDVEADTAYAPFLEAARAAGYRSVVSVPLLASDGTIQGVLNTQFAAVYRPDERALRRMELYARQASDFIERCSIEETLRRSEEALRESDRRKSAFMATLAHEMRNPLAPIRSGLQVMQMAQGDLQIIERARMMMDRQVDQMVRLVDDLMDVSRIGQGKVELRRHLLNLNSVVDRAIETCRPRIEAASHRLVVATASTPIWVNADDVRLVQVIANLLTNAAKYTDRGGVITVRTEQVLDQGLVRVIDTGVGISPHQLETVFDLFAQIETSLDRSQGGLGIGLSLVKGLVEMHGGTVEAHSEGAGKGSEFVVRLPVDRLRELLQIPAAR